MGNSSRDAACLNASSIPFSAIAGFGMANKGEPVFCPVVMNIGVLPRRINFEEARKVARHVKNVILYDAGFGHVDVAIREWVTIPLCGTGGGGMKHDFLDPFLDKPIIEYRYQFSSTPSLNIAPLAEPDDGGTASLYFRLDSDSDDVFLLTAAHVVCPPSSIPADKVPSQVQATTDQIQPDSDANKVISLDVGTYSAVSQAISCAIDNSEEELKRRENEVEELREVVAGAGDSERKDAKMLYYARQDAGMLQQKINLLWELNSQIIEFDCSNVQNRVIGTVIHADPIGPGPTGVTLDWAAIKIDHSKFNWSNFGGNRVYIGEQIQLYDWYQLMHPNHHDGSEGYHYPVDGLLEVKGVVPEHELHRPNALNTHNERGMPVVKNGRATCTTFGWVNGLKTLARHHIKDTFFDSRELTIIPYSYDQGAFSGPGDSGSAVFDKRGRVVGMITSATKGVNEYIDLTYATPFHELDSRIKEVFPRSSLYPAVNGYY